MLVTSCGTDGAKLECLAWCPARLSHQLTTATTKPSPSSTRIETVSIGRTAGQMYQPSHQPFS